MSALHHTKGIVIRTVKYGETSLVVSLFTEKFGLQQYMVNGVRTSKKNTQFSASQMQVGNILELVVYRNEKETLQRIKECKQACHYESIFADVIKNAVLLFMIELLQKCLKEPDEHQELFHFMEDILLSLDTASSSELANIPLFFALHLSHFFGFRIMDNYQLDSNILDLIEGKFVSSLPLHSHYVIPPQSECVVQFLRVMQINELSELKLNRHQRNELLDSCIAYYSLHISPFGNMRSLPVLRMLMEEES
jgi:DNA repair protein RecO (recombination protein O)